MKKREAVIKIRNHNKKNMVMRNYLRNNEQDLTRDTDIRLKPVNIWIF
jgi:hypothetical protein